MLPIVLLMVLAAAPADPAWKTYRTEHFLLESDSPEPLARDLAQALSRIRTALLAGMWGGLKLEDGEVEVVSFAQRTELQQLLLRPDARTAVDSESGIPILVIGGGGDANQQYELVWAEAKHLAERILIRHPYWLPIALAEYSAPMVFFEDGTTAQVPLTCGWTTQAAGLCSADRRLLPGAFRLGDRLLSKADAAIRTGMERHGNCPRRLRGLGYGFRHDGAVLGEPVHPGGI